jgi:4-hydroxy-tetrahydrodipicolinate synthase
MHEDGSVDYPTLRKLVDWHIAEGTDCIGVVGTTGESPTVDVEEHQEIIASPRSRPTARRHHGRLRRQLHPGSDRLARYAQKVGADLQLQVVPYYNKPTQKACTATSRRSPEATGDLPTVLYNVPGRTWPTCSTTLCCAWRRCPASSASRKPPATSNARQWLIRDVPKGFAVYSGDDPTAVALMLCGGQGNVSVTPTSPRA